MKKNRMLRLASTLMILTLLTTSIIGGTFAKYTTTGTASDTARVAKWGVEIETSGDTFKTEYAGDDTSYTLTGKTTVVASTNAGTSATQNDLVAPGTKGNMATVTLSGKPEVAVSVTYNCDFEIGDNWTVNGSYYCPLIIKIPNSEGTTTTIDGINFDSATEFETAVENAINAKYSERKYAPNSNLSENNSNASLSVQWEWPFERLNEANNVRTDIDEKDTALGNALAPAEVTLAVSATVTQID